METLPDSLFEYKGKVYPSYLKSGNACSFVVPFALKFCKGKGLDVGGYLDWTLPGSIPINIANEDEFDAMNLPSGEFDFIFSSHTLEHLPNYVEALVYWKSKLKKDGSLFLYLPHPDMEYWLPQFNKKHLHQFSPDLIEKLLHDIGFRQVLVSGRDLYWSFSAVAFA
jgi:hypothetical protein